MAAEAPNYYLREAGSDDWTTLLSAVELLMAGPPAVGRTAPTATGIGHPFTGAGPYAFARMFERRLRLDDGPFE